MIGVAPAAKHHGAETEFTDPDTRLAEIAVFHVADAISALEPSGTCPIETSVAGSITSNTPDPLTRSPFAINEQIKLPRRPQQTPFPTLAFARNASTAASI